MVRTTRRSAVDESRTRTALLDAAQELMIEEGYAAVSSRRVGAKAGMNPAMVHYYFGTMDGPSSHCFVAGRPSFERLARALLSAQPLWGFWEATHDQGNSAMTMEFIALANHRKAIRSEIAGYSKRFRQTQLDVLSRVLVGYGVTPRYGPR